MSELIDNRVQRIRTLKSIIKELHAGAPPDDVGRRLKDLVRETDAGEIAAMEQELIADGMPVEEVAAEEAPAEEAAAEETPAEEAPAEEAAAEEAPAEEAPVEEAAAEEVLAEEAPAEVGDRGREEKERGGAMESPERDHRVRRRLVPGGGSPTFIFSRTFRL